MLTPVLSGRMADRYGERVPISGTRRSAIRAGRKPEFNSERARRTASARGLLLLLERVGGAGAPAGLVDPGDHLHPLLEPRARVGVKHSLTCTASF